MFILVGLLATSLINILAINTNDGFLLSPWSAMEFEQWKTMALLAVAIITGSVGAAIAYQNGPPSIIGVFDFGYVGFSVIWTILFFNDVPDLLSIFGIGLIVIAGAISVQQHANL